MQTPDTTDPTRAEEAIPTARRPVVLWPQRPLLAALSLLTLGYLAWRFEESVFRPSVDLAWPLAIGLWLAAYWRREVPSEPRLKQPYWLYALYLAATIPFATNWRWVMAGDLLNWPTLGLIISEEGLRKSMLSVNGPDMFSFLHALIDNVFMFVIQPTLFWHKVGRLCIAAAAMAAIFTVSARLVHRRFGMVVAVCSSACSVWIVYSFSSGPFMDGLAAGYALLAIGLWIGRDISSVRAWLTAGAFSGFMLFLHPAGWYLAVCVWVALAGLALWHRRVDYLVLAGVTGLIVGGPMLAQWLGGSRQMMSLVDSPEWSLERSLRFLQEAAYFPCCSLLGDSGAFGPQLPQGFRWLFVAGILVTPLSTRWFPGSRLMAALFVANVLLLAVTQGPYGQVSVKRALVLVPMATFFALLPFQRLLRYAPVALLVAALWVGLGVNDIVNNIRPGRTGYNIFDGVVEAHQRFAPHTVCVYMPADERWKGFNERSMLSRLYDLSPRLQPVVDLNDPACREVLCHAFPHQGEPIDLVDLGYEPVELLNTVELRCGRKAVAPSAGQSVEGGST